MLLPTFLTSITIMALWLLVTPPEHEALATNLLYWFNIGMSVVWCHRFVWRCLGERKSSIEKRTKK